MTMLHQYRNDAQPRMKSVLKGFGDVSSTSDLWTPASAGVYKFCTSGYRRALLAKSIPNSEYHLKTILSDADLQLLYGLSDRRTVLRG